MHTLSVISRSEPLRRRLLRLAPRLGRTTSGSIGPGSRASETVLFHWSGRSALEARELRELVRETAPGAVIVLAEPQGEDGIPDMARRLGAADLVPLSEDDGELEARLVAALDRLRAAESRRCPGCPVAALAPDGRACPVSPASPRTRANGGAASGLGSGWSRQPFVAASPAMLEVLAIAHRVADSDATVLITGETGAGKEALARYIHRVGSRAEARFVKVHCPSLPEALLESELFGYEKGAFTGAGARKPGRIETAQDGVLILDEISETSLPLQAKLLQLLQEKRFTRLGGLHEVGVDVQIIVTTNQDLAGAVRAGRFREDLYYRLKVVEIHVPPLRERREEIPALARYFRCRFAREHGLEPPELPAATIEGLASAPWAGNVRELENAIRRLVLLGREPGCVPTPSPDRQQDGASGGNGDDGGPRASTPGLSREVYSPNGSGRWAGLGLKQVARTAAREAEREAILDALQQTRWNRLQAARRLGVSYKTLLARIRELIGHEA